MKDTPVPIPNTKVKLHSADGTARETVWKSRSSPGNSRNTKQMLGVFLFMQIGVIPIFLNLLEAFILEKNLTISAVWNDNL